MVRPSPARAGGLLAGAVLAGGLWVATAAAQPTEVTFHLSPAPTSVDHAPFCPAVEAPSSSGVSAGATAVTFIILPKGC